jgi:hypothetical protein
MAHPGRLSSVVNPADINWPLLILGVFMIVAGVGVPGTEVNVVVALIVLGTGLVVAGALASQVKQLDIGLQGIKMSRDDGTAMPMPWLAAEADTLGGIAQLVLGNSDLAGEVVEDVLTKIHRYPGQMSQEQRDIATFKTLIADLERTEKKLWFSGSKVANELTPIQGALNALALPMRVAFVLDMEMPVKAVAEILDRPEADVAIDVEAARKALAPHIEGDEGDGNG